MCLRIFLRVSLCLIVIAAADYGYQWWRNNKDLMMTKQEVKEETKNTEGNQQVKAARRRRRSQSKAKQLAEVPKADVIVVNPTHIAVVQDTIAKPCAPKNRAKGIRLNAQKSHLAQQHQIPDYRKHPAGPQPLQTRAASAAKSPRNWTRRRRSPGLLAHRVNRYRYYTQQG